MATGRCKTICLNCGNIFYLQSKGKTKNVKNCHKCTQDFSDDSTAILLAESKRIMQELDELERN